jgi:hypothetical protein
VAVETFRRAPTARERIVAARALVRAVRGEFARQAKLIPTPEARLALSELEDMDVDVSAAERTLADADALRMDWTTAVAATLGWVDPTARAGNTPLPPAHELPAFVAGPPL